MSARPAMPIAIDIALIPDAETIAFAIRCNEKLRRNHDGVIRLAAAPAAGHGLPHVSLAMFTADDEELDRVGRDLESLARRRDEIQTRILGHHQRENTRGTITHSLDLEAVAPLAALHRDAMETFADLMKRPCSPADFVDDGDVAHASDASWVEGFSSGAAGPAHRPHVTLGFGALTLTENPSTCRLVRLGAYRLGAGCTCRVPLVEVALPTSA